MRCELGERSCSPVAVLTQPTLIVLFLPSLLLTPTHRAFRIPNGQRTNGSSPIKVKFTSFETEYRYDAVYIVERENFDDVPSASAWTTTPRSNSNSDGYSTRYWGPCTSSCTNTNIGTDDSADANASSSLVVLCSTSTTGTSGATICFSTTDVI